MLPFLAKRWFLLALLASVGLALGRPNLVAPWTAWLEPRLVIACALFLMAWTMPRRSLLDELARPWASLWAIFISYGPVPAAAWLLGEFSLLPDMRVGLLLSASVPCTLASAVLWTRLARGNEATALVTTLGTTFLSWAATTFWLTLTTGTAIELAPGRMMLDLLVTLVVPVLLGQLARSVAFLRKLASERITLLGVLSQVLVLSIVLKTAAGVGLKIQRGAADLTLATLILAGLLALTLHLGALFGGLWSSRLLGLDRPRQIAVAFSCSQKTLPVSLFLFETYYQTNFPLAVIPLLFYHVGQLILDTFIADRLAGGEW